MSFASPSRSSSTLDRLLRHGSPSHSQTIYSRSPTKPKRLQSAHLDEATGLWRCQFCGYNYPNPEPHHHQRRAHKKICDGGLQVQRWLSGSGTEGTDDSRDTSNVVDKPPTTPETADTATSALSLGKKDENDGADRVRGSDLAGTGDGSRVPEVLDWEQLLDRESKSRGTPSGNELQTQSETQELGDEKVEVHGEPTLSGIVGSGENLEVPRNEELDSGPVRGEDLKPLNDDPGRMHALHEADSSLLHEPSQDRSDQVDFSGVPTSEFEDVSKDSDSRNKEGRVSNTEKPSLLSSQNEGDSLKAGEDAPQDVEEGDPRLVAAADDALKEETEVAAGAEPTPLSHEKGLKDQADLGEGSKQREPSLTAADDLRDNRAEMLQESEDGEPTLREDDDAQKEKAEMGEGPGDILTAADESALGKKEEEGGTEQGLAADDEDGKGHVEHSDPSGVSGDATENKSGDTHQSLQFPRDGGDGPSGISTSQGQSDHLDLQRHETKSVGTTTLKPVSEAEDVNETPSTSRGLGKLSSAERNWDDWEHVVSGEDMLGETKGPQVLQEIGEGGLPFSVDGLTSHDQSDNLENDGASDKNASKLEKGDAGLKSDQDTGNEFGFQPAGADWILGLPDTVNETVDKQLPDPQSSTWADYHSTPDKDGPQLIPGLDQEGCRNRDLVATVTPASQQQTDQPDKVAVRLSAAETNWDDWEDVIKRGPTLIKGTAVEKAEDPESFSGEYQTPRVGSLEGVSGFSKGKAGKVLEPECVGGVVIDTPSAGLPVTNPKSESSDWLIDFSEPSVESNPGTANEDKPGPAVKLEIPETKFFDLLELNEGSGQEQGASLLDTPVTSQSETGQSSKVQSKISSAMRNWEDWEEVVRESERVSGPEKTSPLLESDLLGAGEHHIGLDSPRADTNIVETGSIKPVGLEDAVKSPPVANNSTAALKSGQEGEGVVQEADGDPRPKVAGSGLHKNREVPDSGLERTEGGKEVDSKDESPLVGIDRVSTPQEDWDDWEDVKKRDDFPAGSRQSSPSFEDAHDGELSSEHEYSDGHTAAMNLATGKRDWADWEDLTKSEYMLLDGPRGQKLTFKRVSDPRESLSGKPLIRKISPSFEEADDGGSPFLRRNGRAQPFEDGKTLKSTSPGRVVKSDYSAGSNSFQGIETTPRSLPESSPRKSDVGNMADKQPLVTRRPLIYRGSRRDYASEVEDTEDVRSEPQDQSLQHQHQHHHNQLQQEDALKYDVEKVLRGQTKYELICPICGALITRKIILRKKKRRFLSEGDPRWRRAPEITPAADPAAADDGIQSPRSDKSSEMEDASANWNKGIRPCFGYLFGK